jgi:hypothetical protein
MPPALTDYTFAFGETGTVLNTDSIGLPFVDVTQVSGLDTAPLRTSVSERHGKDGTHIDSRFASSRTIVVDGTLYTDSSDPDSLLDSLRRDYASDAIRPFYFQLPGRPLRFVNCQGGGAVYDVSQTRRQGVTPVQFVLLAEDPYIYDYPSQQGVINVPTVIAVGTGFNMAFNVGFGGGIPTNSATVGNSGTHTAYPTITIQGPVTNPVLTDGFGITMAMGITLAATDYLVIDCRQKSIVLNGQASRRNVMSGLQWFSVPGGMPETIFFSADAGTGSATVLLNSTYY